MSNRILVTGAGGFLGSHIACFFKNKGFQVLGIGRNSQNTGHFMCSQKITHMALPDRRFLEIIREYSPNALIHCAGTSSVARSVKQPYSDFKHTVEACAFTLEAIRKEVPNCFFVLLSSAAVYGNPERLPISENMSCKPISPYGYHKLFCEKLVEEYQALYGISAAVLRVFSAYGEGLRKQVIFDLCKKITNPNCDIVSVYGTGEETRDFIHYLDILRAIEKIYKNKSEGTFNLASGVQTKISRIVELLEENLHGNKPICYTGTTRQGDPVNWQGDISRLYNLGFESSVSLETGISNYCQWFQQIRKELNYG